jgi:hypothetical protein
MNKYIATIKVKGQSMKTAIFADSTIHARLILQYQFGMNSIVSSPTLSTREDLEFLSVEEALNTIKTIKPIKPLTPQQARVDALKRQKEKITKDLNAERARQKLVKDQNRLFNLSR